MTDLLIPHDIEADLALAHQPVQEAIWALDSQRVFASFRDASAAARLVAGALGCRVHVLRAGDGSGWLVLHL